MDKEEIDKIKNAVMQIYEGNESKGLDILCLLVGWIPNSKSSQQPVEADAEKCDCTWDKCCPRCEAHKKECGL